MPIDILRTRWEALRETAILVGLLAAPFVAMYTIPRWPNLVLAALVVALLYQRARARTA
ncbi:hypothetical protein ACFQPA_06885 [Halomarina halobia]|uniref:Uncharacterized protein n=1 Tax=Halomarina halobia TaxID=3033386 RepID=A0ABD6A731_9EURY|nr:hypothetical protein [Halomarina sp. PSR21]